MVGASGPSGSGIDDLGVLRDPERRHHLTRQIERFRQHADDLMGLAVEDERPANRLRVAAVAAHPRPVTEHRGPRRAGHVVFGGEEPARRGAHAEHGKKVRRHTDGADALRVAAVTGQVVVSADRDGELLEALMPRLDVEILCGREPVLRDAEPGRAVPQNGESIGIGVRERPQQQRVRHAENRGVRADAYGQRQHGRERKPRAAGEGADGVADVLAEHGEHGERI